VTLGLLLSGERLIAMVFSKLFLEHQATWPQKFILNKDMVVHKLISLLLESFFLLCTPDIHHSNRLHQKMPTTKLWQWETMICSGKPIAEKNQVKVNSSLRILEIFVNKSGNLIQMKELQWMEY